MTENEDSSVFLRCMGCGAALAVGAGCGVSAINQTISALTSPINKHCHYERSEESAFFSRGQTVDPPDARDDDPVSRVSGGRLAGLSPHSHPSSLRDLAQSRYAHPALKGGPKLFR